MYRLLAADMDGTLFTTDKRITAATTAAIKELIKNGLIFSVSSGRPLLGITAATSIFKEDMPCITFNGAVVITDKSREIIYKKALDRADSEEIFTLGREMGIPFIMWGENELYCAEENEITERYHKNFDIRMLPLSFGDLGGVEIIKYLFIETPERVAELYRELSERYRERLNIYPSSPRYLEFVDKNAGKGEAMRRIGERYGIKREEMIAVGDGYNDLSMLRYAGFSVAMGNAAEDIKNECDFVTLTNDEEGVLYMINKLKKEGKL